MSDLPFSEAERLLRELGAVPDISRDAWLAELKQGASRGVAIELAVGVEAALSAFAIDRHPTEDLQRAFEAQYPHLAANTDVASHYESLLDRGPDSAEGFVHGLRGKLFELRLPERLEERFPGFDFKLSESATEPGWDLVGTNSDGIEIFVQAKARGAAAASDVIAAMQDPDAPQFLAATEELHSAILDAYPEFADRLISVDLSHMELNEEAEAALSTISEQLDLDVPDAFTDMLPYIGEIVLGIRLVADVVRNEKALSGMPRGDKNRLHAVRTLALMARFGVSTVMTAAGGAGGAAAGSLFPGAGTAIGGVLGTIGGAISAGVLNRKLQPRLLDMGLDLAGLTKDDLFYYQNQSVIDRIGLLLCNQRKSAESLFA